MPTHEIALNRYPAHRPEPDRWATPDGQCIRMNSRRHGSGARFTVHLVGQDARARRDPGGPELPGPWGFLVCQATVIAAHPGPQPLVVDVAVGDVLRLRCWDEPADHRAPVLVYELPFRIADDRRGHNPYLVALPGPAGSVDDHGQR